MDNLDVKKQWSMIVGALDKATTKGVYTLAEAAAIANSINNIASILFPELATKTIQNGTKK
jgi:hypothetical protein